MKDKILGFIPSFFSSLLLIIFIVPLFTIAALFFISIVVADIVAPSFVLLCKRVKIKRNSDGKYNISLTRK